MEILDVFNRAVKGGGSHKDKGGPMPLYYLTLRPLTDKEYAFLFKLKRDYVWQDIKVFTDENKYCWMIDKMVLGEYPKDSWIRFVA